MNSTLRLDSYSKQTSYSLSFCPFRCSTSCLPHGVPSDDSDSRGTHTLLYQTLGLTLYFCLYFSGLDSSTGLFYSKQISYLLSFCPFRCSTSCLPHGVPSDDSDSRGTHSSIPNSLGLTLYFCLYFSGLDSSTGLLYSKQTSYLLYFCPFRCSTSCLPHGVDSDSRGTHTLLYQTLGLTLYFCLYFSGFDSSTGLLYSKQTSLLSFSPFRCSTYCLSHGPSDDSDSRGTHSSIPNTWINTLFLSLL